MILGGADRVGGLEGKINSGGQVVYQTILSKYGLVIYDLLSALDP